MPRILGLGCCPGREYLGLECLGLEYLGLEYLGALQTRPATSRFP